MTQFCADHGILIRSNRYLYNKAPFALDSTPNDLEMGDQDKIGVILDEEYISSEYETEEGEESDSEKGEKAKQICEPGMNYTKLIFYM